MRFSNLTITLTLTCLSIVAIAGLALFPITEGICSWTLHSGGYSANYYASENQTNDSWYLTGDVNAKGVSASGSVSILNPDRYQASQGPWYGTAEASAERSSYNYSYFVSLIILCNNPNGWGGCAGHDKEGDADSNVEGNEGFTPGRHTDITLTPTVDVTKYKIASGYSNKKKRAVSGKVSANYGPITADSTFTYEGETIRTESLSAERERKEVTNDAHTSSHSASVSFDKKANSSASASVSFKGSGGSKSFSYSP